MAKKKSSEDEMADLLKTLLTVQLRLAGVSGGDIRPIVGGDMNRVTKILKRLPRVRAQED